MYNYPGYQYYNYNPTYANQTASLEEAIAKCNKYTQDSAHCENKKKESLFRTYSCKKWLGVSANELERLKDDWCGQVKTQASGVAVLDAAARREAELALAEAAAEAARLAALEGKEELYGARASKWFIYVGIALGLAVAGTLTWYAIRKMRK